MRFPGENYQVYAQNPLIKTDIAEHIASGVFRFLYTEEPGRHRKVFRDLELCKERFQGIPWEFVTVTSDTAKIHTHDRITDAPVWELFKDSGDRLRELAAAGEPKVFIRIPQEKGPLKTASPESKRALRDLWEVALDCPSTTLIAFGGYSPVVMWQMGLHGAALSFRDEHGRDRPEWTPFGREQTARPSSHWSDHELLTHRAMAKRKIYRSMVFAKYIPVYVKEYYEGITRIKTPEQFVKSALDNIRKLPEKTFFQSTGKRLPPELAGDKILCDTCSLQYACRIYKERSVCALPGKEFTRIAEFFGTRDSDDIIDGIGEILKFQADRFEQAIEREENRIAECKSNGDPVPDLDPEINKMANDLQKNAERLAKLVNPLLTRPQVAIQQNFGKDATPAIGEKQPAPEWTPKQLSGAARELEAAGVSREQQTIDMIQQHLLKTNGYPVLEGEVVNGVKNDF